VLKSSAFLKIFLIKISVNRHIPIHGSSMYPKIKMDVFKKTTSYLGSSQIWLDATSPLWLHHKH
jgi:hypothetical protein